MTGSERVSQLLLATEHQGNCRTHSGLGSDEFFWLIDSFQDYTLTVHLTFDYSRLTGSFRYNARFLDSLSIFLVVERFGYVLLLNRVRVIRDRARRLQVLFILTTF